MRIRQFLQTALLATPLALAGTAAPVMAGAADAVDHTRKVKTYKGTETCLRCHEEEAEAFFYSQHYQWSGETPHIVNSGGQKLGKLSLVNDFCTNPSGEQWIGEVPNDEGKVLARGCSTCHSGLGLMPSKTISQEQLENIDCLICHASGYRRSLYRGDDREWEWKPILWRNQEGMDSVARRISSPKRTMCLRCHSASGGGPNYKRGDIEYTLKDPPLEFDVHMSPAGQDMHCVDCHASDDMVHRVKGRGVDMAASDSAERLACDGACHGNDPHELAVLNKHSERVYCASCHITTFARDEPTDMFRDWSDLKFDLDKGKYTYPAVLESDVQPEFAWFNGRSYIQTAGTPVRRNAEGLVIMVEPEGSRADPASKIFPFKIHRAKMPVLDGKDWILPIYTEEVYKDGDVDHAIRRATENLYGLTDIDYDWETTIRYMGIFHEVEPAGNALQCLDCHHPEGRMDWQALGYAADPLQSLFEARADTGTVAR